MIITGGIDVRDNSERGVITLEASISVLSFLVLMFLISSFFVMFMAQNVTAHVTLQTAESLSFDAYKIEKLMKEDGKIGSLGENLGQFITKLFGSATDNPYFVADDRWYDGDAAQIEKAIKNRFVGYLAGGNEVEADEMLLRLNIVNGLSGLNFSESYVVNDTLYIVLKYTMECDFNMWGLRPIEVEQRACSKLWK